MKKGARKKNFHEVRKLQKEKGLKIHELAGSPSGYTWPKLDLVERGGSRKRNVAGKTFRNRRSPTAKNPGSKKSRRYQSQEYGSADGNDWKAAQKRTTKRKDARGEWANGFALKKRPEDRNPDRLPVKTTTGSGKN